MIFCTALSSMIPLLFLVFRFLLWCCFSIGAEIFRQVLVLTEILYYYLLSSHEWATQTSQQRSQQADEVEIIPRTINWMSILLWLDKLNLWLYFCLSVFSDKYSLAPRLHEPANEIIKEHLGEFLSPTYSENRLYPDNIIHIWMPAMVWSALQAYICCVFEEHYLKNI